VTSTYTAIKRSVNGLTLRTYGLWFSKNGNLSQMISLGRRAHAWWALQIARIDGWMPYGVIDSVKNVYEYEVQQQADVPQLATSCSGR
jgi:hypothetical protein